LEEINLLSQRAIKTNSIGVIAMLDGGDSGFLPALRYASPPASERLLITAAIRAGHFSAASCMDNGFHIAAAPRDQDHDVFHGANCSSARIHAATPIQDG
jgi:hypothetical protein